MRKECSVAFCLITIVITGCNKEEANDKTTLKALKELALAANSYAVDQQSKKLPGVVELGDIWNRLTVETRRRLLQVKFSYFPMRTDSLRHYPLAIANSRSGLLIVYADGSIPLDTADKQDGDR